MKVMKEPKQIFKSPKHWNHKPLLSNEEQLQSLIFDDSEDGIVILGCGTSTGSPVIGCRCKTCTSKNKKNRRLRASVIMESRGKRFLIDTSPDLRQQSLSQNIFWIDGILMTHPHADHFHGLDDVRSFNFLQGKSLPLFGNQWTLRELKERFGYIFAHTQEGGGKPHLDVYEVDETSFFWEGIKIQPLPVPHGDLSVLGYRINDMAYLTDCSDIPESTLKLMTDLKILVLDCLRFTPHPTHLNVDQALKFAKKIGAEQTYLTHMGHDIEYDSFKKSLPKSIYPCFDGQKIKVSV